MHMSPLALCKLQPLHALYNAMDSGADPGFSERGVRKFKNLKKGVWSVAPEVIGVYIVNTKIIHLHEHMFKQLSLAT